LENVLGSELVTRLENELENESGSELVTRLGNELGLLLFAWLVKWLVNLLAN